MHYFLRLFSYFFKITGSQYYLDIAPNTFFTNFLFQKIFKQNSDIKHQVKFTSLISGYDNIIFDKKDISILKSFAVSGGCYFGIANNSTLTIGNGTIWAWNLNIQTANHDLIDRNKFESKSIIIGKNCWIGGNVTILPGVEIGDNVTIGANSVVTKSFPANTVIAGCPAKIIKTI